MKSILLSTLFLIITIAGSAQSNQPPVERKSQQFSKGDIIVSSTASSDRDAVMSVSDKAYQNNIIGVYNGEAQSVKGNEYVTQGFALVKYKSENGKILAGDPLTSSSAPGVAMKASKSGIILGIACEDAKADEGLILIRVMVQYTRF